MTCNECFLYQHRPTRGASQHGDGSKYVAAAAGPGPHCSPSRAESPWRQKTLGALGTVFVSYMLERNTAWKSKVRRSKQSRDIFQNVSFCFQCSFLQQVFRTNSNDKGWARCAKFETPVMERAVVLIQGTLHGPTSHKHQSFVCVDVWCVFADGGELRNLAAASSVDLDFISPSLKGARPRPPPPSELP